MSFQPVITLTTVPRDNSSFTVTDATPTGGATGWGSTNAPTDPTVITSLFASIQQYGGIPINANGVTGSVPTTMQFAASVLDGVNNFIVYYGFRQGLTDYTVSADGLSIVSNDPSLAVFLDGVTALSLDGVAFPVMITSINGNTITLASSITPGQVGTGLFKYYQAIVQGLTINNGEALIVNGISLVPVEADHCENSMAILDNIILKIGAQVAFGCGNISKAHEAAVLLSGNKPFVNNTCATCG